MLDMTFGRHTPPTCTIHAALGKTVGDGGRVPCVFESDACVSETQILQLLFLRWVKFTVVMILVTVEYLLCSYLVFEGMKR